MKISKLVIWLFVVILGLEIGAGLYETVVVVPVWATGAPESVVGYYNLNAANPQFALNAGPKFWMFLTPTVALLSIVAFATSFKTSRQHRKWRIAGSLIAMFVVAFTFAWFVPNIMRLLYDAPNMTHADIVSTAKWWVNLNWGRVIFGTTAWLCTLRAFSIPQDESGLL